MWKEIDNVVGVGRLPSLSDRPNLPYCEAVILESLRLGNIIPLSLPHITVSKIEIIIFILINLPREKVKTLSWL
jgi:hypothetical protein